VLLRKQSQDGWPPGKSGLGSQKRTILCHWVVTNGIRASAQPEMVGACTSPWGLPAGTRWDAKNGVIPWGSPAGTLSPKGGWLWHLTSPGNGDVLICINSSFITQRILKPWWSWTYQNSVVKRTSARAINSRMGDLLGSLVWGAKSRQYCGIGGGSLHRSRLITPLLHTLSLRSPL